MDAGDATDRDADRDRDQVARADVHVRRRVGGLLADIAMRSTAPSFRARIVNHSDLDLQVRDPSHSACSGSQSTGAAAFPTFLHHYNHHRGHAALKDASPASRVPNLCGQNN